MLLHECRNQAFLNTVNEDKCFSVNADIGGGLQNNNDSENNNSENNPNGGSPGDNNNGIATAPVLPSLEQCEKDSTKALEKLSSLNLSDAVKECLTGSQHCVELGQLVLFTEMNTSASDIAFGKLAAQAICDGDDVDYEERVINKLTNICAKNIFTELENGIFENHPLKPEVQVLVSNPSTLNFSESILKLFSDSARTHLIIQNGNTGGANASTSGATITVNDSYLTNATKLSIARTIIHESVHTYLNALYSNVLQFNSFTLRQKIEKYARDNGYVIGTNQFHHNFMGQYIDGMAYSLYEWDKEYGTGGNLGWDYYKSMVYAGMFQVNSTGTITFANDTFRELVPNANNRQEIANIILNEQNGNSNAQGTECN